MRYRILFLFGILPIIISSQNPLKKGLIGNGTSMHYSPSQFNFTNQNGVTVYLSELKDRRSLNWNKQINDSVKIEAIGDYWNYPMNILFKNKINQDLTKANINIDYSTKGENIYKVDPTLDVLYPNFVLFPNKGYWVLSKINMQVSKGSQTLFTKSYQEYTLFDNTINGYKEPYNSDLKEGANVAMWSSVKRLLDQFYTDLNDVFGGKQIQSSDIALNSIGVSNITNDASLNNQVANYSGTKNTKETTPTNNYKIDEEVPPPAPSADGKLINAVNSIGKETKTIPAAKKPTSMPIVDSAKLAERKLREEQRRKVIDSARVAKEELALTSKKMEQEEKEKIQLKRDSILKVKKEAITLKVRERFISDSIKKAEVNQKIEDAKKKKEEERAKLNKKQQENIPSENTKTAPPKNVDVAIEKKKPQSIAKMRPSRKVANESISDAMRRIAQEVEDEEDGTFTAPSPRAPETNANVPTISNRAKEREKIALELKQRKIERDSLLAIEKQKKQDSLMAIRKAKALEIEQAMARAKASKDSFANILAAKRYVEDSIQLVREKERRREAVLAAQKSAIEAERNALIKNPTAGEMFATVSTDPPSKLPDSRTREQINADRIFTPKSENTKNLLARVKLITPEEEARLLAQMKTDDRSVADSFFIQLQKNRPVPSFIPLDTFTKQSKKTEAPKNASKEDIKSQIIEKGLKGTKENKVVKSNSAVEKNTESSKNSTTVAPENKSIAAKDKPAAKSQSALPNKVEPPALDSSSAEKKAQDLEAEIEKKKKEINDRLKKAKSW